MNVAELVAKLAEFHPDTPIRVVISDEFDTSPPVELHTVYRIVDSGNPYVELAGEL